MISVPFSIRWKTFDRRTRVVTRSQAYGLARLEAEELVLQYRVRQRCSQGWVALPPRPDSEVREARIPLDALRSARVARRWWRTRVVLSAADLRPFADLPGVARDQLVLEFDRAHRTDAADLASSLELSLTTRFLDRPVADSIRLPSP